MPLLVFIIAALLILFLVADRFLLPALAVSRDLEPGARKQMAAIAALVMTVVLTSLVATAILVIRPGRFFLPRKEPPRTRTNYPDAWAESGRRMETPPADDDEATA
jgi:hypothetical protein